MGYFRSFFVTFFLSCVQVFALLLVSSVWDVRRIDLFPSLLNGINTAWAFLMIIRGNHFVTGIGEYDRRAFTDLAESPASGMI